MEASGAGLPAGEDGEDEDEGEGGGGGEREGAVAGEEEADAVEGAFGEGGDWFEGEVVAEVVRELGGGLVAFLAVAAEGFEDDGVKCAGQLSAKDLGGWFAGGGDGMWAGDRAGDGGGGWFGFGLGHYLQLFESDVFLEGVRAMAGE